MKHTPFSLPTLFKLAACAALVLAVNAGAQDKKADPSGTWTWSTPGRDGGPERKSTLTLKADGDKVTGKISSPGRQGAATETEISDGKLTGDEITFNVTREFNGNKITAKYNGKIAGDSITGKIETERNGEARSRDWTAKREGDKK